MTGALRVPVLFESWQIQCCGTPPAIGDRVDWGLVFDSLDPGADREPIGDVELDAVAVPVPWDRPEELPATRLDAGGLHAHWRNPEGRTGPLHVSGRLINERHGGRPDGSPPTVGTIARVRIVTRQWVEVAPQSYEPGPERPRYRDVGRSPKFFPNTYPYPPGSYWGEDGVVVDLVVDGPAGAGGS